MAETLGTPKQEIKLFYCYAHEDKALRDELQVNLSGLRRQYHLTNWYDREILPGEPWEEAIDKHLSTADVILLLISPHFVDSDYCYGKEMQRALERHHAGSCCVIPILIRPTYWEDTPLSTIQMLPTDAKPITSWPDHYEAFHGVARDIGNAIRVLLTARKTKEQWWDEGKALSDQKRYEEALTAFEQALRLDPNYALAHIGKANALSALKLQKTRIPRWVIAAYKAINTLKFLKAPIPKWTIGGYKFTKTDSLYVIDENNPKHHTLVIEAEIEAIKSGVTIFEDTYQWTGQGQEGEPTVISSGHTLMGKIIRQDAWNYYYIGLGHELNVGSREVIKTVQEFQDEQGRFQPFFARTIRVPLDHLVLRVRLPKTPPPTSIFLREQSTLIPTNPIIVEESTTIDASREIRWEILSPSFGHRYSINWRY